MNRFAVLTVALTLFAPAVVRAQLRVSRENLHERLLAVVPLVGTGKNGDPIRPLFAPLSGGEMQASGLIGFTYDVSDDGKFAIVEFVSTDRRALVKLAGDPRVAKAFIKGATHKPEAIEAELRKWKKDYKLRRADRGAR